MNQQFRNHGRRKTSSRFLTINEGSARQTWRAIAYSKYSGYQRIQHRQDIFSSVGVLVWYPVSSFAARNAISRFPANDWQRGVSPGLAQLFLGHHTRSDLSDFATDQKLTLWLTCNSNCFVHRGGQYGFLFNISHRFRSLQDCCLARRLARGSESERC